MYSVYVNKIISICTSPHYIFYTYKKNLQVDDSVPMINCLICGEGYPMNEMTAHQQKTHLEQFQAVKVILYKTMLNNTGER